MKPLKIILILLITLSSFAILFDIYKSKRPLTDLSEKSTQPIQSTPNRIVDSETIQKANETIQLHYPSSVRPFKEGWAKVNDEIYLNASAVQVSGSKITAYALFNSPITIGGNRYSSYIVKHKYDCESKNFTTEAQYLFKDPLGENLQAFSAMGYEAASLVEKPFELSKHHRIYDVLLCSLKDYDDGKYKALSSYLKNTNSWLFFQYPKEFGIYSGLTYINQNSVTIEGDFRTVLALTNYPLGYQVEAASKPIKSTILKYSIDCKSLVASVEQANFYSRETAEGELIASFNRETYSSQKFTPAELTYAWKHVCSIN